MAFQNVRSPNFENFGIPKLRIPKQNDIWMHPPPPPRDFYNKKFWFLKILGVLIFKIWGFQSGEAQKKITFGGPPPPPVMINHKEYYKGEGGGFP